MSQSMPWMKFAHREYMVSISRAALKPIERLAFLELAMYANIQPNRQLPDNDAALAGWAGISLNNWLKMKDRVFSEWVNVDGFWKQPNWMDLYSENAATDEASAKTKSRAEIQKEYRARNKGKGVSATSLPTVTDSVTNSSNAALPSTTDLGNDALPNGGIKGGDLDQDSELDSDLNQNLKNIRAASQHTKDLIAKKFDVFWTAYPKKTDRKKAFAAFTKINPSEDLLKTMLSGIASWSSKWIAEPQYTPHPTTWLNGERWNDAPPVSTAKPQNTTQKPIHGNVNAAWGNPPAQNLDSGYVMDPELAKRIAELPV